MMTSINNKYNKLKEILQSYDKVLIALSGGLDSSFLLFATLEALGEESTYAAIGISPSLAKSEYQNALKYISEIGLPQDHLISIETQELEDSNYRENKGDRCYFCKQELYSKLHQLANQYNITQICDGANASDQGDFRPGMKAATELEIQSPLLEADLSKDEIRQLAKNFNLKIWDKPQSACLASRIPYNSEVTAKKLKEVEDAEDFLKSLGFRNLRVRHHGNLARIELDQEDMIAVISNDMTKKISEHFRKIGFLFTTLDICGFNSGSMNIMLKGENNE